MIVLPRRPASSQNTQLNYCTLGRFPSSAQNHDPCFSQFGLSTIRTTEMQCALPANGLMFRANLRGLGRDLPARNVTIGRTAMRVTC